MRIIRIPTFWTADQAETIHEFLGELQAAVWQEYHEDIQHLYDDMREQAQEPSDHDFDDDIKF